jgi:hypothetical protein
VAWRARLADCRTSVNLLRAERREVDLILTTERAAAPPGDAPAGSAGLVGRDGRAWRRDYRCRSAARTAPSGRSRSRR